MIYVISLLLVVSLAANVVLAWYTKKIIQRLSYGVSNLVDLQGLLDEYANGLQAVLELEQFYGDETLSVATRNTRMVVEVCKAYKKTIEVGDDNGEQNIDDPKPDDE